MKIEDFLRNHFESRLVESDTLIIYDPLGLYREIVLDLNSDQCTVVDGSKSTIVGREAAMSAWQLLSVDKSGHARLVVYLPLPAPRTDAQKQNDPYVIFGFNGGIFPRGDMEEYQALCRQACPDQVTKVDALFADGIPDFATINNVIAGTATWPKLKTMLGVESAKETLCCFLVPTSECRNALDADMSWQAEMRKFLQANLGMSLKTKSVKSVTMAEEIWRFLLFSEFVFDLPESLPESLMQVPRAEGGTETLVYSVCDSLRGTDTTQLAYMERADRVAEDLKLFERAAHLSDLGERDTFAFEERLYLGLFSKAAMANDLELAGRISTQRKQSIWVKQNGDRQQLWTIADRALQVTIKANDLEPMLKGSAENAASLFDFYCTHFRVLDSLHRAFEHAVVDVFGELDCLDELVSIARQTYRKLVESLQSYFLQSVECEGWPISGKLRQTAVFNAHLIPSREQGHRVALFMVDALRYELAAELEKELSERFVTNLTPVCAQLPTVTSVGMAAILPGSENDLSLTVVDGKLIPHIGNHVVTDPESRLSVVKEYYGDKCMMVDLDVLINKKKLSVPKTIDLLMVKTTDIDSIAETKPVEASRFMPRLLKKIMAGVRKVESLGYDVAVLVTDHGFILWDEFYQGDKVGKPDGDWVWSKDRALLGKGSPTADVLVLDTAAVGIPTDAVHYAVPRSLGTFTSGKSYSHSGLSLQECVVPFLSVTLTGGSPTEVSEKPELTLTYKGQQSGSITTRRPMLELALHQMGLFEESMEFALEAFDGKTLVGETAVGQYVNDATGLITMQPGQAIKVPLKMEDDFEGSFIVRASDPETGVVYASVNLQTNYVG